MCSRSAIHDNLIVVSFLRRNAILIFRSSPFRGQVKVIAHQAIGMNLPIGFLTRLSQSLEQEFSVLIIAENVLPVIPSIHDVINRPLVLNSKLPGHGGHSRDRAGLVNTKNRLLYA
jgi:hypothetical protein